MSNSVRRLRLRRVASRSRLPAAQREPRPTAPRRAPRTRTTAPCRSGASPRPHRARPVAHQARRGRSASPARRRSAAARARSPPRSAPGRGSATRCPRGVSLRELEVARRRQVDAAGDRHAAGGRGDDGNARRASAPGGDPAAVDEHDPAVVERERRHDVVSGATRVDAVVDEDLRAAASSVPAAIDAPVAPRAQSLAARQRRGAAAPSPRRSCARSATFCSMRSRCQLPGGDEQRDRGDRHAGRATMRASAGVRSPRC